MTNVMSFFSKCTNEKEPISFASKIGCKQALMFEMSRHVPVRIGKYAFLYHSINKLSLFLVCNLQSKKKIYWKLYQIYARAFQAYHILFLDRIIKKNRNTCKKNVHCMTENC